MKLQTRFRSFALIVVLVLAACGGKNLLQMFRGALAASDPLINSLVASGAVSGPLASSLRTDFSDGVKCGDTLYLDFSAIAKDDPDAKRKKLNASVKAARCFKVIVDRQNFAKNPKTKVASDIAEGILASLVAFYSESGTMRADSRSQAGAIDEDAEKELEKRLKSQVEALKRSMQP